METECDAGKDAVKRGKTEDEPEVSDRETGPSGTAKATTEPLPPANAPASPPRTPVSAPALPRPAHWRSPVPSSVRHGGGGSSSARQLDSSTRSPAPAARSAALLLRGPLPLGLLHLRYLFFRCVARGLGAQQGAQD